jgi:hypothetical protein
LCASGHLQHRSMWHDAAPTGALRLAKQGLSGEALELVTEDGLKSRIAPHPPRVPTACGSPHLRRCVLVICQRLLRRSLDERICRHDALRDPSSADGRVKPKKAKHAAPRTCLLVPQHRPVVTRAMTRPPGSLPRCVGWMRVRPASPAATAIRTRLPGSSRRGPRPLLLRFYRDRRGMPPRRTEIAAAPAS